MNKKNYSWSVTYNDPQCLRFRKLSNTEVRYVTKWEAEVLSVDGNLQLFGCEFFCRFILIEKSTIPQGLNLFVLFFLIYEVGTYSDKISTITSFVEIRCNNISRTYLHILFSFWAEKIWTKHRSRHLCLCIF